MGLETRRPETTGANDGGSDQDWQQWSNEVDGLSELVDATRDAIPIVDITEEPALPVDPRLSYAGWEERARDTAYGRSYELDEVVESSHSIPRGVGKTVVAGEVGISHRDYGMPHISRILGRQLVDRPRRYNG